MEPVTYVLAGIVLVGSGAALNHVVFGKNKVGQDECLERRENCNKLHGLEKDYIDAQFSEIKDLIKKNGHNKS